MTPMFAAFIGGWELLLIAAVLGAMAVVPLVILAIVLFIVNRQKKVAQTAAERPHCN